MPDRLTILTWLALFLSGCHETYDCHDSPVDQRAKWVERCVDRLAQDPLALPNAHRQCVEAANDLFCVKVWK